MRALKGASRRNTLVVATCELARGAYGKENSRERTTDLAAFKESGGIEYGAHLLLLLREREPGIVDVSMPKNRWGRSESFRLVLDHERAAFAEVAVPSPPARATVGDSDAEAVRQALRQNPGVAGKVIGLFEEIRGYALNAAESRALITEAIEKWKSRQQ